MEGIARFIHETTSRIVHSNPDIEFHFLFDRPFDEKFVYADNVRPHIIGPPARHPILWYIWFEHAVKRFMDRNGIDVFYSGDMYLSLASKIPTLYVSHDLNYIHYPEGLKFRDRKYLEYFFPRYHRRADHIIAVSEYTKSDITRQFDILSDRITVAYNDAPGGFRPFDSGEKQMCRDRFAGGKPYFIYVGSLHPRKNLARLLSAFDAFRTSGSMDCRLVIYGRKAFKTGDIFSTYNRMSFRDDVLFVDGDTCNVQDILPGAMALCYPSLFEGFGIPILEAFHSEVPVITSNVSSMPEVAGDAACYVNPFNISDIEAAMHKLLDGAVSQKLVDAGKQQKRKFSWDRSADIISSQLRQLFPKGNA